MNIEVSKKNIKETRTRNEDVPSLSPGQIRVAIESFGLTSNNITYAVMGDLMNYWQFFPVPEPDTALWGHVPVWGFAHVSESMVEELEVGTKIFGYFPMAESFVMTPGRLDETGFSDAALHRSKLPTVYNRYAYTTKDPLYSQAGEGTLMLLRPLFITSFVVDDFIVDNNFFGAQTMLISSASAKTAIAAAFLLAERDDIKVVGLTSEGNLDFVNGLSCYDEVLTYDHIEELKGEDVVYIDVAGRRDVTHKIHHHYGDHLKYSMIVGDTHWDNEEFLPGSIPGPRPTLLFAPVQIAKRRTDWGRDAFEEKVADAWHRFLGWTNAWLKVESVAGADEITATYGDLLDGRIDPSVGHVCRFLDA